jgi:hypothetical protein
MTDDGNVDDDCGPAQELSPPDKSIQLNPEIVKLAEWSPQESKGLHGITTKLVKRGLIWIESILLGVLGSWLYAHMPPAPSSSEPPPVVEQQPSVQLPTYEE